MPPTRLTTTAPLVTRHTPIFQTSTAANVTVPLQQAAVSGALCASAVIMVGAGLVRVAGADLLAYAPTLALIWFGLALLLTAYFWFRCLAAAEEALWKREIATGEDENGDGQLGKPRAHPVMVGARPEPEPEADWLTLAQWFVMTSFRLGTTAERILVGKAKPDGLPLTQAEYDELRDTAIWGRYAAWKNRNAPLQGWTWLSGQSASSIIRELTRYVE